MARPVPLPAIAHTLVVAALVGCGGKGSGAESNCDGYVYCGDSWGGGSGGTGSGGMGTNGSPQGGSSEGGTTTCAGFAPCGGVLDGTWQFDSVCVEGEFAEAANAKLIADGAPPPCEGMYQTSEFSTTGTVTFKDGMATSDLTNWVTSRIAVTVQCDRALSVGSGDVLTAERCANIELRMLNSGNDSASCRLVAGVCACEVTTHWLESPGPWDIVIFGDTVSFVETRVSWKYCVDGHNLAVRWAIGVALPVMAVGTLHRI